MKKMLAMLLATLLCATCACGEEEEEVKMADALKISAWVMEDGLWGTGVFTYDETISSEFCHGYWLADDGTRRDAADIFALERLEVGEKRVCAPLGYHYDHNLNLWFDFEGIIEVEKAGPHGERLWMRWNLDVPMEPWDYSGTLTKEQGIRMKAPAAVSLVPIGKFSNANDVRTSFTLPDNEYNLIIRAYDYDETLLITAEIRLTTLPDPHFPWEKFSTWVYSSGEEKTRFLEIELVSYEYSDVYKFDEAEEKLK